MNLKNIKVGMNLVADFTGPLGPGHHPPPCDAPHVGHPCRHVDGVPLSMAQGGATFLGPLQELHFLCYVLPENHTCSEGQLSQLLMEAPTTVW